VGGNAAVHPVSLRLCFVCLVVPFVLGLQSGKHRSCKCLCAERREQEPMNEAAPGSGRMVRAGDRYLPGVC